MFSSLEAGVRRVGLFDFGDNSTTWLTQGPNDYAATASPDGAHVAFIRDGRELRVIALGTTGDRLLASGSLAGSLTQSWLIAWSPDSRWVATLAAGPKGFMNVGLVPLAGGDLRMVSALPNMSTDSLAWSPDGRAIYFATGQRTEQGQVAQVDLTPRMPPFREDAFRKLFEREQQPGTPAPPAPAPERPSPPGPTTAAPPGPLVTPPAGTAATKPVDKTTTKPVEVVFDGILRRVNLLPIGLDVSDVIRPPRWKEPRGDGRRRGQTNVYTYSIDDEAKEPATARQITSSATGKGDIAVSADGKEVFFLEEGRIGVANIEKREARTLTATAEFDADFESDRLTLFDQAWSMLREHFYDPGMHGVDWEAQRARFAPVIAAAATHAEFRRALSLMIGDLDASHLGVSAPPGGGGPTTGRLESTSTRPRMPQGACGESHPSCRWDPRR